MDNYLALAIFLSIFALLMGWAVLSMRLQVKRLEALWKTLTPEQRQMAIESVWEWIHAHGGWE